jgi:hypothetical protein|uniref:Uncharacterized protein n=1 Tax=viral metagenome TaxID=1070528 RepID=A0A6C0D6G9_9ZZZZ
MADKSTLLRSFNTHLFEFLDDIIRIFPDNVNLQTAKTSFQTIKRANPTAIAKVWFSYIYMPYREVIDSGDIQFFFQKDYSEDLSILQNSGEIIKIIDTLREPVSNMSETEKAFTMKYLQNLSKLSMLYSSM